MKISFDLQQIDRDQLFAAERLLRQIGLTVETEYQTKTCRRIWSIKKKK